ncbi:MAG: HlyD family efflux transporter periplasmic adaptor subunit [Sedimentisphaerales bacterium]|nr:HlyD family efflux transporter periplasmic adaptor subunit [Sedimentisphaerales bacterium]
MPNEQATQRIAEVLGRLKQLPGENLEPPQFFANFLQLTVAVTGSRGGGIWLIQQDQPPQMYCHMEIETCGISESDQQKRLIVEAIQRVVNEAKPLVLPPADAAGQVENANQTEHGLFFLPMRAGNQVAMILQLIGAANLDPGNYRTIVGLAGQAVEAAESYLAHRRAAVLEDDRKSLANLLQYSEAVHNSLDAEKVVYQLANLGRDTVGCTRVVIWIDPQIKRGLRAVSGVDKPDRRAVLMQAIEKLCRHCLEIKKPIVASRQQLVELDEEQELTLLLKDYFTVSQLDQIFLQPLEREEKQLGVFVAEGFDESAGTNLAGIIASVARHGAIALSNALEMASVPWMRPLGKLQKAGKDPKKKKKWAMILVVLLAGLVAGSLVPWTIKIDSDCTLTPVNRRIVDSPLAGVEIAEIVRPSGTVEAGEVIIRLDDSELKAERDKNKAELEAVKVEYNQAMGTPDEEHYRLEMSKLQHQIELIQLKIDKCLIRAPVRGQILTAQLELLEGKTLERGDPLLEIADMNRWEILLQVPQQEIGWVQRGLEEGESLVQFYLAAYPEHKLSATIKNVDQVSQMARTRQEGNVFEIRTEVDPEQLKPIQGLRDGSTGTAKIWTVEKPLGYVLLRKVIRFFRVVFF